MCYSLEKSAKLIGLYTVQRKITLKLQKSEMKWIHYYQPYRIRIIMESHEQRYADESGNISGIYWRGRRKTIFVVT